MTIAEHCGHRLFDVVLLNGAPIPLRLQRRYLAERSRPVEIDLPKLMDIGLRVVTANMVPADRPGDPPSKWVRHDPTRLAKAVMGIATRHMGFRSSRRKRPAR